MAKTSVLPRAIWSRRGRPARAFVGGDAWRARRHLARRAVTHLTPRLASLVCMQQQSSKQLRQRA